MGETERLEKWKDWGRWKDWVKWEGWGNLKIEETCKIGGNGKIGEWKKKWVTWQCLGDCKKENAVNLDAWGRSESLLEMKR